MSLLLDVIPDDLKRELLDGVVHFLVGQAERMGGDQIASSISHLSSQAVFQKAFDSSMEGAIARFRMEYMDQDEDLVIALTTDGDFWKSKAVRQRLMVRFYPRVGRTFEACPGSPAGSLLWP